MFLKRGNPVTLTSEIRLNRCSACGTILQNDDPNEAGYISSERLEKNIETGYCDACYNLRHYNSSSAPEFGSDYIKILSKATSSKALVVYMLDLFAFEGSLIKGIGQYLGDNVLVILNKRDVLPKNEDDESLIREAKRRLLLEHITPKEILVTSSSKNLNLDVIFKAMNDLRDGKDVYFIGASSVGKSTMVNAILRSYKNDTSRIISTFKVEGTLLDVMEIPLDDESSMYDTPGIYSPESMLNQLERPLLKYVVPREEVTPRVYSSASKQAFIFGGIAVFELEDGPKTDFSFTFSNDIAITRTKSSNLEKTFDSILATKSVKPVSSNISSFKDLDKKEVVVPARGNMVIRILGFGFIKFTGQNQKIAIYVPHHVGIKALAEEK